MNFDFKKKEDLLFCRFENGIINKFGILFFGHCSSIVLEMHISYTGRNYRFFYLIKLDKSIGLVLKTLSQLILPVTDDMINLNEINNKYCRVVLNEKDEPIGIGNLIENKFVLEEDLKNWIKKN